MQPQPRPRPRRSPPLTPPATRAAATPPFLQEAAFITRLTPTKYAIAPGFVPNMRVPGAFYVNDALKSLVFDELADAVARSDHGGFLPAVKQVANVAALPGIVGVSERDGLVWAWAGGCTPAGRAGRLVRRPVPTDPPSPKPLRRRWPCRTCTRATALPSATWPPLTRATPRPSSRPAVSGLTSTAASACCAPT